MTTPHDPTTILSGGYGAPTMIIRDHDGWRAQVDAENRSKLDAEVKSAVEAIQRAETERKYAPPIPPGELRDSMIANVALVTEAREAPFQALRELEQVSALIEGMRASEPPPGPDQARRDADNAYSNGLREWKSRAVSCGHQSCMPGRCVYGLA